MTGNEEAEAIRAAVSRFANEDYEFQQPSRSFPSSTFEVTWLIVSRVPLGRRSTAYAPVLWEESDGTIRVESIQLSDMAEWIYEMYGESGSAKAQDVEQDYSSGEVKEVLKKHFPRVYEKALRYEKILSEVSTKTGVRLELEYSRNSFIITLYAMAGIDARNLDTQSKIERIKLAIDAIKDVISGIDKLEEGTSG